jgi:hypothetical protein
MEADVRGSGLLCHLLFFTAASRKPETNLCSAILPLCPPETTVLGFDRVVSGSESILVSDPTGLVAVPSRSDGLDNSGSQWNSHLQMLISMPSRVAVDPGPICSSGASRAHRQRYRSPLDPRYLGFSYFEISRRSPGRSRSPFSRRNHVPCESPCTCGRLGIIAATGFYACTCAKVTLHTIYHESMRDVGNGPVLSRLLHRMPFRREDDPSTSWIS